MWTNYSSFFLINLYRNLQIKKDGIIGPHEIKDDSNEAQLATSQYILMVDGHTTTDIQKERAYTAHSNQSNLYMNFYIWLLDNRLVLTIARDSPWVSEPHPAKKRGDCVSRLMIKIILIS